MYACMYVLYAYIRVCMYLYVYACMYICMHVCIDVCIYVILKLGFERYKGGIVLVGRGNCPGGIVRGNCPGGKCPGPPEPALRGAMVLDQSTSLAMFWSTD